MGTVKSALKRLRVSQPFNRLATSSVRSVLGTVGLESEMVVKHLHRIGIVQSPLPNGRTLRLWSKADDWVSNLVYWRGWEGYEPETVPLFFRLAARARVTIDVGAYVGFFSLLAGHANTSGLVYAFEPMLDPLERLRKNVSLNELTNVQGIQSAVGDVDGTADFYFAETPMPCSSSLSYDFMKSADALRSQPVALVKLDTFVNRQTVRDIDLVKIDTESTEHQVLRGMMETIRRDRPQIICEVLKDRASEDLLQDLVREIGYRAYLLTPDGPSLRDRIEGHPSWLNYLFTSLTPPEVAQL